MNKFRLRKTLILIFVTTFLLAAPTIYAQKQRAVKSSAKVATAANSKLFQRTELFFGSIKAGGAEVSAEEWQKFLADEVTPRFPEGFTVLEGYGQFRNDEGRIVREKSFVLVVVYPFQERRARSLKLEEIRQVYLKAFDQQSVLRVDFPNAVMVSF